MIRGRARSAARSARDRLLTRSDTGPSDERSRALSKEVANLRRAVRRDRQQMARLQARLTALEEEVSETRRIGQQVGHLGDLVTALLAHRSAGSDPDFARDLATYADDL